MKPQFFLIRNFILSCLPLVTVVSSLSLANSAIRLQDLPAAPNEEKVYSKDEVDVRAKIKNLKEIDPLKHAKIGDTSDCLNGAKMSVKAVLHKSGKVTEVEIIKPMQCGLDKVAVKAVRRAKFTLAMKNGAAVSQYVMIEFQFHGN